MTAFRRSPANDPQRLVRPLGLGLVVLGLLVVGGCNKPLLAPDEERSQYDRFDAVRDQRAAPYIEDEFGFKRPNLRGRLIAKD